MVTRRKSLLVGADYYTQGRTKISFSYCRMGFFLKKNLTKEKFSSQGRKRKFQPNQSNRFIFVLREVFSCNVIFLLSSYGLFHRMKT